MNLENKEIPADEVEQLPAEEVKEEVVTEKVLTEEPTTETAETEPAVKENKAVAEPVAEKTEPASEEITIEPGTEEVKPTEGTEENEDYTADSAKWYVLHTFSGYENVAKENLETVVDKYGLQNRIFETVIPMEDVVEDRNGKRKIVSRKVMPGYILVKMNYGDDIWHAVTRTRGITGFVGPKGRPLPLTQEEIRKMRLEKVVVVNINLSPNDKVEILDGPLNSFAGTVISVDTAANKVRVMVEMFGREIPVDLALNQIRKLD